MSLRKRVLKLAYQREDLRSYLLPLIEKDAGALGSLSKQIEKLQGVDSVKVISDKPTLNGKREVILGIYMDAEIGATKGRQHLTRLVRKELDRAVSKYPVVMIRMLSPSPGLDPFGRPGVGWDTHRERFQKYYSEHPYKLILETEPGVLRTAKDFWVELRELPPVLQRALKSVGYRRKDIRVEPDTTYSPSEGSASASGQRGYVIVVNMQTGQMKTEMGSWGGPNPFERKQVDLDRRNYPIPANGAVVVGESGGRGSFARIKVNPSNLSAILPSGDEDKLPPDEQKALNIIGGIKGGHRVRYFERNNLGPYDFRANPLLQSLAKKGMIKANRAGAMKITTKGRNAMTREIL